MRVRILGRFTNSIERLAGRLVHIVLHELRLWRVVALVGALQHVLNEYNFHKSLLISVKKDEFLKRILNRYIT